MGSVLLLFNLHLKTLTASFEKNALLSVTNTFEGRIFTPATVSNITGYIQSLFPLMTTAQVEGAVQVYALFSDTWPTLTDQAVAIRGECTCDHCRPETRLADKARNISAIFICPTYDLLRAFPGRSWKVS